MRCNSMCWLFYFQQVMNKCLSIIDSKYNEYYQKAKDIGSVNAAKEREFVEISLAIREIRQEFIKMNAKLK